jgi:carboxyl-terminal processing protease
MTFKIRISRLFPTSLIVFMVFVPGIYGQDKSGICQKALILTRTFENNHYKPRTLDDSLSVEIFYRFLTLSDPDGLIFTSEDVNSLSDYKYRLDDLIKSGSCEFLDEFKKYYIHRLIQDDSIIASILSIPLNYNEKDSISFNMSASCRKFPGPQEK